jgi:signal transduction histidine kinase
MTGDGIAGIYASVPPTIVNLNRLFDLSVYLLFIWIFHSFISLRRQLEQRVRQRTAALEESVIGRQRLERELLDVAAAERNSIGHELHDDLCQHLVGTALAAKVLGEQLAANNAQAADEAQSIVNYLEESIAKTRGLARGLLLATIEPAELGNELAELAAKGSESAVTCRFKQEGHPAIASASAAAQLFRIAQEAMRNALRHARPTRVDIILTGNAAATFLTIEDNGCGLPAPETRGTGMGLQIMAHRAAFIGGTLSIVPVPGEGTRVICHLPHSGFPAGA